MCRTKIYWLGKFCNIDDAITADAVSCLTLSIQCMGVHGLALRMRVCKIGRGKKIPKKYHATSLGACKTYV